MMKTALFAGTFDPPTLGHYELIIRASSLFEKLYVAVAASETKHDLLLSHCERMGLLKELVKSLENVEIIPLTDLVVNCALEHHVNVLIRGLRGSRDIDFEIQMSTANRQMTGIETLCLFSAPEYSHINSTLVREIAVSGRHLKGFVPEKIESKLFKMISKR